MWFYMLLVFLLALVIWLWIKMELLKNSVGSMNGPPTTPIFGNIMDFDINTTAIFKYMDDTGSKYTSPARYLAGPFRLGIGLKDADHIETILTSNKITKGIFYDFVKVWLNEGLLTTSQEVHWHKNRKLLTPAFHFKILERFIGVFQAKAEILMSVLRNQTGQVIEIFGPISRCALDIITETAMGVNLDIQKDKNSEYLENVKELSRMIIERSCKPWLYNEFIYGLTKDGRETRRRVSSIDKVTTEIIKKCRQSFHENERKEDVEGAKKKLAFLNLLLEIQRNDPTFDDEDIKQEIKTFMFAGHDTTATTISFCLYSISKLKDVQNSIMEELDMIFGDSNRAATFHDLQEMNYLERVIKETMRLYPSVPLIIRRAEEDIKLRENVVIPKNAEIGVYIRLLHLNEKYWSSPLKFDPDRFLPEKFHERHPFSYIPFSGGLRNCIGQKFAMLEMKMVISTILRNFSLFDAKQEELELAFELILKSKNGIKVGIDCKNL